MIFTAIYFATFKAFFFLLDCSQLSRLLYYSIVTIIILSYIIITIIIIFAIVIMINIFSLLLYLLFFLLLLWLRTYSLIFIWFFFFMFSLFLFSFCFPTEWHCVKSVRIRIFSGPHFRAFGLNTERYGVSLRIQSECGKMRTRITPNTGTFYAMWNVQKLWIPHCFFKENYI